MLRTSVKSGSAPLCDGYYTIVINRKLCRGLLDLLEEPVALPQHACLSQSAHTITCAHTYFAAHPTIVQLRNCVGYAYSRPGQRIVAGWVGGEQQRTRGK